MNQDAVEVRGEDRFDTQALHRWLSELQPDLMSPPEVLQFSGGASNLTYLLRYPGRDLILRRAPAGEKAASAHDMAREFRIQQALAPVFAQVPKMVGLCRERSVIGCDFYIMERVHGTILRGRLPQGTSLNPSQARALCESAIDTLAELHRVDVSAAALADLGKGEGYVARQLEGWSQRYRAARTWNTPSFERVIAWLCEHQPPDLASCLIHGDFRLDNLVLAGDDPQRILAVLDWEMATIGDPLMDLASAMAYWVQADDDRFMGLLRRQPTHLPGMLTRSQVIEHYAARSGRPIGDWSFYEVFGLFRLAVIIQQIYRRYHLRQTRNRAFRNYWLAVGYLDRRCRRIIRHGGSSGERPGELAQT